MLEGIGMYLLKLSETVRLRHEEASDNYYLFCIKTGMHAKLNAMSYEIATLLEKKTDKNSIIAYVLEHYDTDRETCSKDIESFLKFLQENGIICAVD
jgi:hypothetical protein